MLLGLKGVKRVVDCPQQRWRGGKWRPFLHSDHLLLHQGRERAPKLRCLKLMEKRAREKEELCSVLVVEQVKEEIQQVLSQHLPLRLQLLGAQINLGSLCLTCLLRWEILIASMHRDRRLEPRYALEQRYKTL